MKPVYPLLALAGLLTVPVGAEMVATSSAPVIEISTPTVQVSTEPEPLAATGETISSPTPTAMTDSSQKNNFLTLTRKAASRLDLPSDADILTPDVFQTFDAQNAADALVHQVGLQAPRIGGLEAPRFVGIRGASSDETLVLVDGRPMTGIGFAAGQDLAEIPVEQIDRIEIVRGGMSSLYGPNALGGVINIITKRAAYTGISASNVSYENRSYGNQVYRLNFGSRKGPVDYFFFGDQQWVSGFRDNTSASAYNIGGNLGVAMGKAGKLLFDAASYHNNAGSPGPLVPNLFPNQFNNQFEKLATTPDARQIRDHNYVRTSYVAPLPRDSDVAVRLFGSERQVEQNDPDSNVFTNRYERSEGGELQFDLPLGLSVGGTFTRDRLDSRDLVTTSDNFLAAMENWGVFAEETWRWDALTLLPSVRYDHNSLAGDATNPRVQAMVDATTWLRFSASAAHAFHPPSLDNLFSPLVNVGTFGGVPYTYQGNPNLLPEKAWTYDAGYEVHSSSMSFKMTAFRSTITNLLQTTPDPASTTLNIPTAKRQGLEAEFKAVISERFTERMNYTYLESRGVPAGSPEEVPLMMTPRHSANYLATWKPTEHLTLDNTVRYISDMFEGNDQTGAKIGDHFLWDMRLTFRIRQMDLYLGVNDILNKRYEEVTGYPLPGRTAYGGLSLRLWG